jgi:clan AA aspartic protease
MIQGQVGANRQPTIRLAMLDQRGQAYDFDAIVDTGFNGSLTLPTAVIAALGLPWNSRGQAILANGSIEEFDIHAGTVIWDGNPRRILVEGADTDPLVGMSLLFGHDVHIEAIDGGIVTIRKR